MVAIYQLPVEKQEGKEQLEPAIARLKRLLACCEPISLAEMDGVSLLNRTDTKYVMGVSQLYQALQQVAGQYRVLEINCTRLNHYRTVYYDTPDFALYQQHHNGLRTRYKVRVREYVDSDLAYWEVKQKTSKGRTVKCRLRAPDLAVPCEKLVDEFIDEHVPVNAQALDPKLWNTFLRMTLVSTCRAERLTLDVNLAFGRDDVRVALPGIAVAEVKREQSSQRSDFSQQMRRLGIRSSSFSKYCTGVYLLYGDEVKVNNFKAAMRSVEKLMQEEMAYEYAR